MIAYPINTKFQMKNKLCLHYISKHETIRARVVTFHKHNALNGKHMKARANILLKYYT